MKRLLTLLTTLLLTSSAIAKEPDTFTASGNMTCDKNGSIIKIITAEYKERPFAMGLGPDDSKMILVVNQETKTWTVLAVKDGITCVLAVGTDLTTFNGKPIKHRAVD